MEPFLSLKLHLPGIFQNLNFTLKAAVDEQAMTMNETKATMIEQRRDVATNMYAKRVDTHEKPNK